MRLTPDDIQRLAPSLRAEAGLPSAVRLPEAAHAEPLLPVPPLLPKDIIGRDDRLPVPDVRQSPWRWVCQLWMEDAFGTKRTGTGWLAGPSTVFTAGHNLRYTVQGHEAKRVWVMPGRDGDTALYTLEASDFAVHPDWQQSERADVDVGVLWLPEAVGNDLGWFGFSAQADSVLMGLHVRTSGYPACDKTKPTQCKPEGTQWFADSTIDRVWPGLLAYSLDTNAGQSGSPVFAQDQDGRPIVVAIHVYGDVSENLGVRLSKPIVETLSGWWR